MSPRGLYVVLAVAVVIGFGLGLLVGEAASGIDTVLAAANDPGSVAGTIVWEIRAPRTATAAFVGGCLGLSGALMQGLLRNPLAEPGVLGVSSCAALAASVMIVLGLGGVVGAVEFAALAGAVVGGAALSAIAVRNAQPETLVLFGVGVSSFCGALTALVFNLSPNPVATSEMLGWLMGSVENRTWTDAAIAGAGLGVASVVALAARKGLLALTLGDETAETLGLRMDRVRIAAVAATAAATGAAVAVAGVVGFVGLAAPHLVRSAVRDDPSRLLWPSAAAGAVVLVLADVAARAAPTEVELKLGVLTALVGAPIFALVAWRSARSWRR